MEELSIQGLNERAKSKVFRFQSQLASLKSGEIKDVVDDGQ